MSTVVTIQTAPAIAIVRTLLLNNQFNCRRRGLTERSLQSSLFKVVEAIAANSTRPFPKWRPFVFGAVPKSGRHVTEGTLPSGKGLADGIKSTNRTGWSGRAMAIARGGRSLKDLSAVIVERKLPAVSRIGLDEDRGRPWLCSSYRAFRKDMGKQP